VNRGRSGRAIWRVRFDKSLSDSKLCDFRCHFPGRVNCDDDALRPHAIAPYPVDVQSASIRLRFVFREFGDGFFWVKRHLL
jgi:hypothetical protein